MDESPHVLYNPADLRIAVVPVGANAIDGKSLLEINEVRRRIQASPFPRGGEYGSRHRGRRTFPLGPREVDGGNTEVRVAQTLEEQTHPVQPEIPQRIVGSRDSFVVDPAEQKSDRVRVGIEGHGCESGRRESVVVGPRTG